ncbi:hypothetical protein GCM10009526_23270 [Glutamicibacter creatinolyticus]
MLVEALEKYLPWDVSAPPGGVSVWIRGPQELDCIELQAACLREGVVIERGDVFFDDPSTHRNFFRLGFAAIDAAAIEPGIRRLAKIVHGLGL